MAESWRKHLPLFGWLQLRRPVDAVCSAAIRPVTPAAHHSRSKLCRRHRDFPGLGDGEQHLTPPPCTIRWGSISALLSLWMCALFTRAGHSAHVDCSPAQFVLRLREKFTWSAALRTAGGMSMISMVTMEVAENAVELWLTGGLAACSSDVFWSALPPALAAGFLTPLPFNYYMIRKHGRSCH